MSRKKPIDYSTTPFQQAVYIALDPDGKYSRTQTQVAHYLDKSKSSVADAVNKLQELHFIRPFQGMKKDILYHKGKNHAIIEKYIQINQSIKQEGFCEDDQGIMHSFANDVYVSTIRAHLNGGWLKFSVIKEGTLRDIVDPRVDPSHPWKFFGDTRAYRTNGATNYRAKFSPNNEPLMPIRYQRTTKGNKFFYIAPNEVIITNEQLPKNNHDYSIFEDQYSSLLSWMEKYGGWIFQKDDCGNYLLDVGENDSKRGPIIEYGFDGPTTTALEAVLGHNVGTPGVSSIWEDNSPSAQSRCQEMETNDLGVAKSVTSWMEQTVINRGLIQRISYVESKLGIGGIKV